jgi:hypothetical protein
VSTFDEPVAACADSHAFTVQGPVQAEILVLVEGSDGPGLTGPCGPEPWYVEVPDGADPMAVAARLIRSNLGEPLVLHSTSWRQSRGGVILTFVAVMPPEAVRPLERSTIQRAELARGEATAAPPQVEVAPVIEHGLRHLAWLVRDDPAVAGALSSVWHDTLQSYVPEPFRHL